jgi:hypothetical protein
MAAAGLATAAAPFVLGQGAAQAAQTSAQDSELLQFVTDEGVLINCTASVTAYHDTDDPNNPEMRIYTSVSGDNDCGDGFLTTTTATYRDVKGTPQRTTVSSFGVQSGTYANAKTNTSVRVEVVFLNCDESQGLECSITLTASPK